MLLTSNSAPPRGWRPLAGSLALALALGTGAGPAAAQSGADARVIEEIVVTALRRDTAFMDTPAALSAMDAATLDDRHATSMHDLKAMVPSLDIGQAAGVDYVSIRGISINSTTGGIENPVAVHLDGVYLAQTTALDFVMMDLATVEVLRGPQGTLYGRNATGGTINFTTAKPTRTFEGHAGFTAANYETLKLDAVLSGPLGDRLSGRLSVMGTHRGEGHYRNRTTGNTLGEGHSTGVRGTLAWEATDAIRFDLTGLHYDEDDDGIAIYRRNPLSQNAKDRNPALAAAQESRDIRRVHLNREPRGNRWFEGAILGGDFDLPWQGLRLKTITSFSEIGIENRNVDTDGTEFDLGYHDREEVTRSWQQQIDLQFDLLDDRLSGLVGAYYNDESWRMDSVLPWPSDPQGFTNISGSLLPAGTATVSYFDQDTESRAVFTDFSYRLTDAVSLFGGYRYSKDKRDLNLTTGLQGLPNEVGLTCNDQDFSADFSSNTGKIGIQYSLASGGNVYAQFQQGYKAGGFNPFGCRNSFEPEELDAFEIGYKGYLFDGTLRLGLTAFHYDYTNLQVAQIVDNSSQIRNAAAATITGLEIQADWALTSNFSADLVMSLMDAEYDEYEDFDTLNPAQGFQDLSGNRLNRAPTASGTIGFDYRLQAGSAGWINLRGELYHSSRVYFRPYGETADSQDSYQLLNFHASFTPTDGNYSVSAFVKNATDEEYLVGLFSAGLFGDRWAIYGPPRTFGIQGRWHF